MPENQPTRDIWRKIEIIGKGILVPLVVALIGWMIKDRVASLEEHSQTATRDFTIINEFRNIYTDPKIRRLAPYYVNFIQKEETKNAIRWFMVWDLLEANLSGARRHPAEEGVAAKDGKKPQGSKDDHRFVFDPELDDWHMLGEVMLELRKGPYKEDFERWWRDVVRKDLFKHRWPNDETELRKLFDWIAQTYWGAPPQRGDSGLRPGERLAGSPFSPGRPLREVTALDLRLSAVGLAARSGV
jgi:hypothetical protein